MSAENNYKAITLHLMEYILPFCNAVKAVCTDKITGEFTCHDQTKILAICYPILTGLPLNSFEPLIENLILNAVTPIGDGSEEKFAIAMATKISECFTSSDVSGSEFCQAAFSGEISAEVSNSVLYESMNML